MVRNDLLVVVVEHLDRVLLVREPPSEEAAPGHGVRHAEHAGLWEAAEGDQSLDLNGSSVPGTVSQIFTTTPGETHAITCGWPETRQAARP